MSWSACWRASTPRGGLPGSTRWRRSATSSKKEAPKKGEVLTTISIQGGERPVVVQAIDLAKRYKHGRKAVAALDGVDVVIGKGEIIGVVGPSGSGKTTFLNLVGGLDQPTQGKVLVDGVDLGSLSEADLADYRLKKIGFIFQFYNLIATINASENVELPMLLSKVPKEEREGRAKELLETVGLGLRTDHMPEELSGGEQQRVAVARALSNGPSVILGDEPTGDLDSKSARSLMDLLWTMRREKKVTFILVTHDPLVVSRCDRVFSIRDGKVVREIVPKSEKKVVSDDDRLSMDTLY